MTAANVFDYFLEKYNSNYRVGIIIRNYVVGINPKDFPLRSRNKTKGFPLTKFIKAFQALCTAQAQEVTPDSNTSQYSSLDLKGLFSKHDSCFQ